MIINIPKKKRLKKKVLKWGIQKIWENGNIPYFPSCVKIKERLTSFSSGVINKGTMEIKDCVDIYEIPWFQD